MGMFAARAPRDEDLSGVNVDGLSHFNAITEIEATTLPRPTRMKLVNSREWQFDAKGRRWKRVGY